MLAFYMARRQGELSRGVPPGLHRARLGFLLGILQHGEKVTALKAGGVAAMLLGIVLLNL
jgi:uncharacterized membrane protein